MLRVLLGLALLALAGSIGFYYGRYWNPVTLGSDSLPAQAPPPPFVEESGPAPLIEQDLGPPIKGLRASDILDTFHDARDGGGRWHEASDIMAPRGTPVVAMTAGIVKKVLTSAPGGFTVYQFNAAETHCFYFAHLDRYGPGLREWILLKKGDLVGFVGSTGNADPARPHLHLAIFELGPDKRWWNGSHPVNPYPVLLKSLRPRQSRP